MTVLIQTIGGFTYAADGADIPKFRTPKKIDRLTNTPEYWSLDEVLLYWEILRIEKGLLYLPGSKEGIAIRNVTIRVRDIVSMEDTDAMMKMIK